MKNNFGLLGRLNLDFLPPAFRSEIAGLCFLRLDTKQDCLTLKHIVNITEPPSPFQICKKMRCGGQIHCASVPVYAAHSFTALPPLFSWVIYGKYGKAWKSPHINLIRLSDQCNTSSN